VVQLVSTTGQSPIDIDRCYDSSALAQDKNTREETKTNKTPVPSKQGFYDHAGTRREGMTFPEIF